MGDTGQIEDATKLLGFIHKELKLLRKIQEAKLTDSEAKKYSSLIEKSNELSEYSEFEGR